MDLLPINEGLNEVPLKLVHVISKILAKNQ